MNKYTLLFEDDDIRKEYEDQQAKNSSFIYYAQNVLNLIFATIITAQLIVARKRGVEYIEIYIFLYAIQAIVTIGGVIIQIYKPRARLLLIVITFFIINFIVTSYYYRYFLYARRPCGGYYYTSFIFIIQHVIIFDTLKLDWILYSLIYAVTIPLYVIDLFSDYKAYLIHFFPNSLCIILLLYYKDYLQKTEFIQSFRNNQQIVNLKSLLSSKATTPFAILGLEALELKENKPENDKDSKKI